jgi:hypothetical protein
LRGILATQRAIRQPAGVAAAESTSGNQFWRVTGADGAVQGARTQVPQLSLPPCLPFDNATRPVITQPGAAHAGPAPRARLLGGVCSRRVSRGGAGAGVWQPASAVQASTIAALLHAPGSAGAAANGSGVVGAPRRSCVLVLLAQHPQHLSEVAGDVRILQGEACRRPNAFAGLAQPNRTQP